MTGIKRWSTGARSKPKLPINTAMLRSMGIHLNLSLRSDSLVYAMMWLATAALLRISEFTVRGSSEPRTLKLSQLSFIDNSGSSIDLLQQPQSERIRYAVLHLEASKTDPFRSGVDIIVACREAVEALCKYFGHMQRHSPRPTSSSPLFTSSNMQPVNRSWFMQRIASLLTKSGYHPERYSSHSFRKGGAVSLQSKGVPDSIVRQMGRWRSDAFHLYVRHPSLDTLITATSSI